mmetsp:Transcript_31521/g.104302  ORF Transcript_31521/g.104302 Transcript_31521/m.104302 type:complete len:425 (-) Transcript_31521:607-1881(-)
MRRHPKGATSIGKHTHRIASSGRGLDRRLHLLRHTLLVGAVFLLLEDAEILLLGRRAVAALLQHGVDASEARRGRVRHDDLPGRGVVEGRSLEVPVAVVARGDLVAVDHANRREEGHNEEHDRRTEPPLVGEHHEQERPQHGRPNICGMHNHDRVAIRRVAIRVCAPHPDHVRPSDHETQRDGRPPAGGRHLVALRGDEHADAREDAHVDVVREDGIDDGVQASEAEDEKESTACRRVAARRAHLLVRRVADVHCRAPRRAEQRPEHRAEAVHHHRLHRRVVVTADAGLDVAGVGADEISEGDGGHQAAVALELLEALREVGSVQTSLTRKVGRRIEAVLVFVGVDASAEDDANDHGNSDGREGPEHVEPAVSSKKGDPENDEGNQRHHGKVVVGWCHHLDKVAVAEPAQPDAADWNHHRAVRD